MRCLGLGGELGGGAKSEGGGLSFLFLLRRVWGRGLGVLGLGFAREVGSLG